MAVLMMAEVPNLTDEIYGGLIGQMLPLNARLQGLHLTCGWAEPDWRLACRRDLGVGGGLPGMVRRERQAEPPSGHRP